MAALGVRGRTYWGVVDENVEENKGGNVPDEQRDPNRGGDNEPEKENKEESKEQHEFDHGVWKAQELVKGECEE